MINYTKTEALDIIPTLNFGEDWLSKEDVVNDILEQHRDGGYTKFIIFYPEPGWIVEEYPPLSVFEEGAKIFAEIKKAVEPYGITLGWWLRNSVNAGTTPGLQKIIKADGTETAFSACPLGKNLRKR